LATLNKKLDLLIRYDPVLGFSPKPNDKREMVVRVTVSVTPEKAIEMLPVLDQEWIEIVQVFPGGTFVME
jgi:hypothetical protein